MKRFVLVFLTLAMVLAINLPGGMLSQFGANPNVLIATLAAVVIAGLIANEHLGLVVVVIATAVAANVPKEVAASIGYDRDIMLALLVGLVLLPFVARQF
mgnify:FL=1